MLNEQRKASVAWAMIASAIIVVSSSAAMAQTVGYEIVVFTREARLRSGAQDLGEVPFLTFLTVKEEDGEWYRVDWQGQTGWIHDEQACPLYAATLRLIGTDSEFDYNLGLARVNQRLRTFDEALKSWNWLCDYDPQNPLWLINRGNCHLEAGQVDAAHSDLSAAIELDPQSYLPYLVRPHCWLYDGDHARAMADMNMAVELAPDAVAPYVERTALRLMRGDAEGALADATRAREIEATSASIRVALGNVLQALSRLDEAYAEYRAALDLSDATPAIYESLGDVQLVRGDVTAAIADYTEGIDRWTQQSRPAAAAPIRLRRSVAWLRSGDAARALEDVRESLFELETAPAYLQLGAAQSASGDYSSAAYAHQRALELDSLNAQVLNDCAWFLATCPESAHRDGARAVELAELACSMDGYTKASYLDTLAAACAETGEFSRAIEWQKHAMTLMTAADRDQASARLAQYQRDEPYRTGAGLATAPFDDTAAPAFEEPAPAAPFAIE